MKRTSSFIFFFVVLLIFTLGRKVTYEFDFITILYFIILMIGLIFSLRMMHARKKLRSLLIYVITFLLTISAAVFLIK